MVKVNIRAFVTGWAAEVIRDAMPTDIDLLAAELVSDADKAAVFQELDCLANQLLAEAMRLEAL